MRKIIAVLVVLVFMFSSLSYSWDWERTVPVKWKAVTVDNTGDDDYLSYSVPTTVIRPGKSILGYTIIPLSLPVGLSNSEHCVGFYDGVGGSSIVSDELFDEAEADGTPSTPSWYPYPRKIITQLMVMVGPNTRVIIYWE